MIFRETRLKGAFLIEMEAVGDERGYFARTWCHREFKANRLNVELVQSNYSHNHLRGTLRGLHYQEAPHGEAKLVHCFRGAIYDVIVDLRVDSPTYLQWMAVELSREKRQMLYVPEGFAHGYQTLEDDTDVFYQMTQFYTPEAQRGARWDDPAFGVEWPNVDRRVIAERDLNWAAFPSVTERGR